MNTPKDINVFVVKANMKYYIVKMIGSSNYTMLCPECKEKYVYIRGNYVDRKWIPYDRGWVLKSTLEEKRKYRENVEKKSESYILIHGKIISPMLKIIRLFRNPYVNNNCK
ncbi:hypothetical protein Mzhil_1310 [Methanosalsum zhilinae DSM 4017]|uniref:Uncharacterized protein n=1 Tax=Methanosalsum zhilinae (strain DSM 4017 / NBRC 107636 / OCM 62 / WeN5) TaxID=679901 RepID=F7XN45_METZD|nr:hypothetical protein [Methanosalsum zhilinae]AEH61161.1 hypothetical protein Mzhil_1310 [Methanosalsum zhilinae DSM 4017]